ncbi:MAG TPA: hypothetical protein VGY97_11205 [Solirubrobacteraceae bacterium]|nr:hypothetical protein [Solirubrobacteraceae bacterium]
MNLADALGRLGTIPARAPAALVTLAVALGLVGCGGGASSAGGPSSPAGQSPAGPGASSGTGTPAGSAANASASTPRARGHRAGTTARARQQPIQLQIADPKQGAHISGGLVFVAGAAEPPGQVTVNGRHAFLEGIGFRLILHYRRAGRKLIRIRVSQPGFSAVQAWIGVCVRPGAKRPTSRSGAGQGGSSGGAQPFSIGALRGGAPAGPRFSSRRAQQVHCPPGA